MTPTDQIAAGRRMFEEHGNRPAIEVEQAEQATPEAKPAGSVSAGRKLWDKTHPHAKGSNA